MKTPQEYKKLFLSISTTEQFVNLVCDIQNEAYNQALKDVLDNVSFWNGDTLCYKGEQSILKLKK